MKSTDAFKNTIKEYLDKQAVTDPLFAVPYANPKKNIDDCVTYILNTVKNSGINGYTDDEIFGMAIHYYQEEDITVGAEINCQVVVNHKVELTEEEIKEAKEKGIQQAIDEAKRSMMKKQAPISPVKVESKQESQTSLF